MQWAAVRTQRFLRRVPLQPLDSWTTPLFASGISTPFRDGCSESPSDSASLSGGSAPQPTTIPAINGNTRLPARPERPYFIARPPVSIDGHVSRVPLSRDDGRCGV